MVIAQPAKKPSRDVGWNPPRFKYVTLDWRYLTYLNYRVPPELLRPFIPAGNTLDLFDGKAWVSIVGSVVQNEKWLGFPVKGQQILEEIQLVTYASASKGACRNSIVPLKTLAPRIVHGVPREAYENLPTKHSIHFEPGDPVSRGYMEYQWRAGKHHTGKPWNGFKVVTKDLAIPLMSGTLEHFVGERNAILHSSAAKKTFIVEIARPLWMGWDAELLEYEDLFEGLADPALKELLLPQVPECFVMKGSTVVLSRPKACDQ